MHATSRWAGHHVSGRPPTCNGGSFPFLIGPLKAEENSHGSPAGRRWCGVRWCSSAAAMLAIRMKERQLRLASPRQPKSSSVWPGLQSCKPWRHGERLRSPRM